MTKEIIRLEHINKTYGETPVVQDMNLTVREGEFLTFLGPSGCGKTTTLRMIAGFETPSDGKIFIDGTEMGNAPSYQRAVNTVFQSYALFPHMTVFDNIAYGLKIKKMDKKTIAQKVTRVLDMVQLPGYESRKPAQLSGGQKQRIAIARALVNEPRVLLLDEPLGALDLKLRKQMQFELKRLQRKLNITFIYVTHDQEEALTMSDQIAVMNGGNLDQLGTPKEIYENPKTKFVADFIGETNLFYGYAASTLSGMKAVLENGEGVIPDGIVQDGEIVWVSVRPENLKLSHEPVPGFHLRAAVKEHVYMGSSNKTVVSLPEGMELKLSTPPQEPLPEIGSLVYIHWALEDAVLIPSSMSEHVYRTIDNPVFQMQA